ncbi:DMT family transporter, partial [candidate division KSB1 bacterium]|nr:DMT family transporter [candidate division KSB1 bacterium]
MPYIGEIAALTGAFFWGWCAIFFTAAGKRIGAFATNLWRILLAIIFLLATLFISKGRLLPGQITTAQIFWLGLSGIVGIAIGDGALFSAFIVLGPRLSTLLLSLAPPVTTILAWFLFDERLGSVAISGILLTIGGIAWVVNERNVSEPVFGSKAKGILMGLVAAFGQGTGVILAKQGLTDNIGSLEATILRMVPAAMVLLIFALFTGKMKPTFRTLFNKKAILATFGGAVFGPF